MIKALFVASGALLIGCIIPLTYLWFRYRKDQHAFKESWEMAEKDQ